MSADPTDSRIARLRIGDQQVFEQLFTEHYAALVGFAERFVGREGAAEDIVQSFFLALWQGRGDLHLTVSIRGYLFAGVRNRALDYLKRKGVESRWSAEALAAEPDEPTAETDAQLRLEGAESANSLRAAIDRLPERSRLVVELRWGRGLSIQEIATAVGISAKGVEIQITRSLKALRRHLGVDDGKGVG